jgi:hypothetical protein
LCMHIPTCLLVVCYVRSTSTWFGYKRIWLHCTICKLCSCRRQAIVSPLPPHTHSRTHALMRTQRNTTEVSEPREDDGFNGWGAKLLQLVDEYEAWCRRFNADARECLDAQGGLVRLPEACKGTDVHAHVATCALDGSTCHALRRHGEAACHCGVQGSRVSDELFALMDGIAAYWVAPHNFDRSLIDVRALVQVHQVDQRIRLDVRRRTLTSCTAAA